MLNRFRLSVRITVLGVGLMLAFTALVALLQPQLKHRLFAEKQEKTRNLVESAAAIIEHYSALEASGEMSLAEAQAAAKALVAALHYDGKNYFWINDLHPTMIMHPVKPELDGKDLTANADPNGKHLFVEMVQVARAQGAGFVDYYWPKPGQDQPAPKLSYVKLEPRWGWIVGSGIYVDDVEAQLASLFRRVFGTIAAVTMAGLFVFIGFAHSLSRPIEGIIGQLESASDRIRQATRALFAGAQHLAQEATLQAGSLESASTALGTMSSMTKRTATNSSEAHGLMQETHRIAVEASASMERLTAAITEITRSSEETSKVVKTIDEIAFQTNILALNAAVEAARAGEAGAGFAVVADEVRALAQRAAQAARNTNELIDDTVHKINAGSGLVNATAQSFNGVTVNADRLNRLVEEINDAAREQAEGIDRINAIVSKIDHITHQNSAHAEESAASTASLQGEAATMHNLTAELSTIVRGTAKGAESSEAASGDYPTASEAPARRRRAAALV